MREDMIAVIRRLIKVATKQVHIDDIDHLGNRRIRWSASCCRTSSGSACCASSASCASA